MYIETVESSQTILEDDSCGFPFENLIYAQLFSVLWPLMKGSYWKFFCIIILMYMALS